MYYLIHGLDVERKQFMERQFKLFGIPEDQVTWITYPNKNDPLPENICSSHHLPRGMIAVTYKHYLALKDIVEKGHEYAVIMEDNIEFCGNVPNVIEKYLKDLPDDWDCVFDSDFFGLTYIESPINSSISVYKKSNKITPQCSGSSKGAHFILISKKGAKLLYDNFLPFRQCSDHEYNDLFRRLNMNVYWAEPPNVHKINRPSTWKDETPKIHKILKFLPIR
jgi:GR25 family glycosyltransferase involved in LPS biosynthesis